MWLRLQGFLSLDDFERVAAGYDMQTLLHAINCPVLMLRAHPAAGGNG